MKRPFLYICIACGILSFTGTAAGVSPVQTEHFRVVAQGPNIQESDLRKIGGDVENVYKQVSDALGVEYKSSGKIEIQVWRTPEKGKALRAAASSATLYLTLGAIDNGLLRHELTHILIDKPLSTAPRWFHEGLAMYMQYGDIRSAHRGDLPPFKDFSFVRLEARFGADKTESDAYLYAWSIISYIMDTRGKNKIKGIYGQSGNFSDKFSKTFGADLRSLEKRSGEIFSGYK